jgi:NADH-quinone oxidoreductase subunit E
MSKSEGNPKTECEKLEADDLSDFDRRLNEAGVKDGVAGREAGPAPAFVPTPDLEARIASLLSRYPQKRSAALMALHAIQETVGHIGGDAIEWLARQLELQPINLYELVTFYPMFRQEPAGRYQFKVCRTLSCALGGSHELHGHLCAKLGLDPARHGLQTTADGRFSVEFVECLASCGTAPVMMCNDDFFEGVTTGIADDILAQVDKS